MSRARVRIVSLLFAHARCGTLAIAVALACGACGNEGASRESKGALGGDVVALVADTPIAASLVGRVAGAQGTEPRVALDRLVDDALAAHGAIAMHLDLRPYVAWSLVATRARFVADRVRDDAQAAGPPTDAEIAELTALHWMDVDAPESVRVVHALVSRGEGKKKLTPEGEVTARALAESLAHDLAAATSAEDFEARARAFPHPGVETIVQRLPAMAADGRVTDPKAEDKSNMDPIFARAAVALAAPGSTSGVVETPFGWHVIRLLERIPAKQPSLDARRALFTDEALTRRARTALDARIKALRAATKVETAADAEPLMSAVDVPRAE